MLSGMNLKAKQNKQADSEMSFVECFYQALAPITLRSRAKQTIRARKEEKPGWSEDNVEGMNG